MIIQTNGTVNRNKERFSVVTRDSHGCLNSCDYKKEGNNLLMYVNAKWRLTNYEQVDYEVSTNRGQTSIIVYA